MTIGELKELQNFINDKNVDLCTLFPGDCYEDDFYEKSENSERYKKMIKILISKSLKTLQP